MNRYEFIEHTADVVIRAHADTLAEAFATAAQGMFDIITDSTPVAKERPVEFTLDAIDRESLLVQFLSQLIVMHEVERVVLGHFEVTFTGPVSLRVTAYGEPFDSERHGQGIHVKAVAYHMLEIREPLGDNEAMVQVLFDI